MGSLLNIIARKHDWPERLSALISARLHEPFEWGKNDCALFAADAVLAMTGHDPAEALRGRYRTARGAKRALKRIGITELADIPRYFIGEIAAEIPLKMAGRGDVILTKNDTGETMLAVCLGARCASPGPSGLVYSSTLSALSTWRIKS